MANEDVRSEMATLKEDLTKLREDLTELVGAIKESGRSQAGQVRDKAQIELEKRLQQLHEAYDAVKREGNYAAENACRMLEDRPVTSVAVAFAAGLLVGRVFCNPGR